MGSSAAHSPWGWNGPARVLLTIIAGSGAVALCAVASPVKIVSRTPPLVLDPNTAPAAALVALPRLGPSLVSRIVEARNAAPFRSLDDLDARVSGIGPTTIAALRPFLHVEASEDESAHPADSNESDERP